METHTAMGRVISSPELLCLILLHLDQRTLLVNAQRVCRAWNDQVCFAPALQRNLFLQVPLPPHPAGDTDNHDRSCRRKPTPNPLLAEVFAPWFNGGTADDESLLSDNNDSEAQETTNGAQRTKPIPDYPCTELYRQLKSTGIYKLRKQSDNPFLRLGSSWMRMHVTDPPATKLELCRKRTFQRGQHWTISELYYPQGLRMGEFYAFTLAITHSCYRWTDMEIMWPPENMAFHRPGEDSSTQAGILRTQEYSASRWGQDEDDTAQQSINADIRLETSEFFGCVIHSMDQEKALHKGGGVEFMWQQFRDTMSKASPYFEGFIEKNKK